MPNVLCDDFLILSGDDALAAMPGAAGGRFATIAVMDAKNTLQFIFRPEGQGGALDVYSTAVVDATSGDANKATLDFTLPAPYGTVRVVVQKAPAGGSSKVHRIDYSAIALTGQFILRFWDGLAQRRSKAWRYVTG